jgi:hypothetical protein
MNKFIKYGTPVMIGMNVACSTMSFFLSYYTLGLNQLAVAMFMFLWYKEKTK